MCPSKQRYPPCKAQQWKQGKLPLPDLGLKTRSQHVQKRKKGAGNAPGRQIPGQEASLHAKHAARRVMTDAAGSTGQR